MVVTSIITDIISNLIIYYCMYDYIMFMLSVFKYNLLEIIHLDNTFVKE